MAKDDRDQLTDVFSDSDCEIASGYFNSRTSKSGIARGATKNLESKMRAEMTKKTQIYLPHTSKLTKNLTSLASKGGVLSTKHRYNGAMHHSRSLLEPSNSKPII